jgi:hypothetical protein
MADGPLSLKKLDVRLRAVEDLVFSAEEVEADLGYPARSEQLDDVLRAIIVSLRQVRQQGAYNYANQLADKYFPGEDVEHIGDQLTTSDSLHRSG